VPVLLFRPLAGLAEGPPTFEHILIPLDGSPLAEQALEPTRTFGTIMGSRYTLLQIVPPFELGGYVPGVDAAQLDREIRQRRHDEAKTYLERVAAQLRAEGATVTTRVGFAKQAAVGVLDAAREHDADLIALATHGRSGLRRLLLGSVADKVVRSADMPVLLYHPHQAS
jgi:nucleotide-binding universal stress UspA family protein